MLNSKEEAIDISMKVLIFGATGMIGRGVLLECLRDPGIDLVVSVGRAPTGTLDGKLREIIHQNFADFGAMEDSLSGFDACFYCLGVSSAGMQEADYTRITYHYTMAAAEPLSRLNPRMKFIFVSGVSSDSTEKGRTMWARVKGRTENALLKLPFEAYVFRPGFIEPMDGIQSRTPVYRKIYALTRPLFPLLRRTFPNHVLTTRQIGRAMINVAGSGFAKRILEPPDIRAAAGNLE
jgi:uncharacterized protein YbjT (DUF2867 family)